MTAQKLSSSEKLKALRAEMKAERLDGFIVPRVDKYQGEFVAPDAERLAWLTGFTGSAGVAIILKDEAGVLTDGRYTLQLSQQIDSALYQADNIVKTSFIQWLAAHAKKGQVIGYDPWLHTPSQVDKMKAALAEKSIEIRAVKENLVDRIWTDRPRPPMAPASVFPEEIAGLSAVEKKYRTAQILKEKNLFAAVFNMPDSLAWLLNIRGEDIESTPVVLSLGVLNADDQMMQWFVEGKKISPEVKAHLGNGVEIIDPKRIEFHIDALAANVKKANRSVALDFTRAPVWFRDRLEAGGAQVVDFKDPCIAPRAVKSVSERKAITEAQVRDGAALAGFLAWLEIEGPKGKLTELDIVAKLEGFRRADPAYKGHSFDTIAGFGPNGAIIHYRATPETNRAITAPGLLLLDSGGQYHYGTTDITRTIAIGTPPAEMKRNFTLVLKGHIALARAKFPEGTTGAQIDALARQPLWNEGLDYAHGTGHGVGCYLSVHEEAASISTRGFDALKAGMLLSNEPGYYKEGHYGIRIENLVFVEEANAAGQGEKMLGFSTVTLVPIDLALVASGMLSPEEKIWLDDYHARVFKTLAPLVDENIRAWLARATGPLEQAGQE